MSDVIVTSINSCCVTPRWWWVPLVWITFTMYLRISYWYLTRNYVIIWWNCLCSYCWRSTSDWNTAVICGCAWTRATIGTFFTAWTICQILLIDFVTFILTNRIKKTTIFLTDQKLKQGSTLKFSMNKNLIKTSALLYDRIKLVSNP